jgi:hypothetical protein
MGIDDSGALYWSRTASGHPEPCEDAEWLKECERPPLHLLWVLPEGPRDRSVRHLIKDTSAGAGHSARAIRV